MGDLDPELLGGCGSIIQEVPKKSLKTQQKLFPTLFNYKI